MTAQNGARDTPGCEVRCDMAQPCDAMQGGPARAAGLREAERTLTLVAAHAIRAGAVSRLNRASHLNSARTRVAARRLAWLGIAGDDTGSAAAELRRLRVRAREAARSLTCVQIAGRLVPMAGLCKQPEAGWCWRVLALARRWRHHHSTFLHLSVADTTAKRHGRQRCQTNTALHQGAICAPTCQ